MPITTRRPPPLYYALHQGLAAIEEEGLANRWERHRRAGEQLIYRVGKARIYAICKGGGASGLACDHRDSSGGRR